jgi:hypothetical protein
MPAVCVHQRRNGDHFAIGRRNLAVRVNRVVTRGDDVGHSRADRPANRQVE